VNEYAATLSIDLGASYTKVSYRPKLPQGDRLQSEAVAKILVLDGSPMIPSLAIYTGRTDRPWVFGREAALLTTTGGMSRFINWKSNFFHEGNDEHSVEATIIAVHFFGWLRERLAGSDANPENCETRVAIPAFEGKETKAQMLAKCMELSGWKSLKILMATEPHANTIGIYTSGKNVVRIFQENNEVLPNYGLMFGQNEYIQAARNMIQFNAIPILKILIVDIGAFTTDFALLTFDTRAEDDGLQHIDQRSHALGVINQLDREVFSKLEARYGFDWSTNTFDVAEKQKKKLYAGERVPILLTGFAGDIGDEEDQLLVKIHGASFAGQIWAEMESLLQREKPRKIYLTGGGALIDPVIQVLQKKLTDAHCNHAVLKADASVLPTTDLTGEPIVEWTPLQDSKESLGRLATAIGGASVIMQHNGLKFGSSPPPVVRLPEPVIDYAECSCRGGNKDCCRCMGSGFVSRR
jgi:hypothetical protein